MNLWFCLNKNIVKIIIIGKRIKSQKIDITDLRIQINKMGDIYENSSISWWFK